MNRYRRTAGCAGPTAAMTAAMTAGIIVAATPASADPAAATLALFAVAEVWVTGTTVTGPTVCARGWVDDGVAAVGQWSFRVVGTTTTHTYFQASSTFPVRCHTFTTNGNPAGTTDASLVYAGIGGDAAADCTLLISWTPLSTALLTASACTGIPTPALTL